MTIVRYIQCELRYPRDSPAALSAVCARDWAKRREMKSRSAIKLARAHPSEPLREKKRALDAADDQRDDNDCAISYMRSSGVAYSARARALRAS